MHVHAHRNPSRANVYRTCAPTYARALDRHPDCNTNNIYITSQQDLIISYCRDKSAGGDDDDADSSGLGSINVSNILNGKSLARWCSQCVCVCVCVFVCACAAGPAVTHFLHLVVRCAARASRVRARAGNENDRAALEDVTALFYNEERNEIYTGNNDGRCCLCVL